MTTIDLANDEVHNPPAVLRHIRNALQEFALSDGPVQHRLLTASRYLDIAMELREAWPEGLYQRGQQLAKDLRAKREWLRRGGGVATRRPIETLGQRLLDLAIDAEVSVRTGSKCWQVVDALRDESGWPTMASNYSEWPSTSESTSC